VSVAKDPAFAFDVVTKNYLDLGFAPLVSPILTGFPTAPTAAPGQNTNIIASTAFVTAAIAASGGGGGIPEAPTDGNLYSRRGSTASWVVNGSAGTASGTTFAPHGSIAATNVQAAIQEVRDESISKYGGTITGDLMVEGGAIYAEEMWLTGNFDIEGNRLGVVSSSDAYLSLGKSTGTHEAAIISVADGNNRWKVILGDTAPETGFGAGSNFKIERYGDGGALSDTPLSIDRATGLVSVAYDPGNPLNVATKGYVDKGTRAINSVGASAYTLVLADAGKLIYISYSGAGITIPTNASVAFPVGTQIDFWQAGAAATTFTAAGGVTIASDAGKLKTGGQYTGASMVQITANYWILMGSIAA
jgi:hypothetical protein